MIHLTEVKISDLFEKRLLSVGTRLFLDGFNDVEYECKIIDEGRVELKINNDKTYWDFPIGPDLYYRHLIV